MKGRYRYWRYLISTYPQLGYVDAWIMAGEWRNRRPRSWVAPRSGGYSARPTTRPRPAPPEGPGSASHP